MCKDDIRPHLGHRPGCLAGAPHRSMASPLLCLVPYAHTRTREHGKLHGWNHLLKTNRSSCNSRGGGLPLHRYGAAPFPTKNGHGNGHGAVRRNRVALGAEGYTFGILMALPRPQDRGFKSQIGGRRSVRWGSVKRRTPSAGAKTRSAAPWPWLQALMPTI